MSVMTALLTVGPQTRLIGTTEVEIVVPVYNEEATLEACIRRLHDYLILRFPLSWRVTIADNASTDATWGIACRLSNDLDGVQAVHLNEKGRGRALRTTWLESDSNVVAYMDVDLSTDLDALLPLVAPLVSGHSDLAIGSRLAAGARVVRGPKREVISRCYNLLLRTVLHNRFSDAQCGFKAMRTDVARALLPLVEDNAWFFDTELLVLAEHNGLRIAEVPVDWVDDPDSRVDITATAVDDMKGMWRIVRRFAAGGGELPVGTMIGDAGTPALAGQVARFAGVGLVSTVTFAVLFLLLAPVVGLVAADVAALTMCALGNTAANRRVTFAVRGRPGRTRHYIGGVALAALPLVLTLGALGVLGADGTSSVAAAVVALTAANAAASIVRFVLLRRLVLRPASRREPDASADLERSLSATR